MAKRNKNAASMDHGTDHKHNDKVMAMQSRPAVRVECPSEGHVIARPSYTFQIAATSGAAGVEVSIDQGGWAACREALGLWWYDWSGFDKGEHELTARSRMSNGLWATSGARRFTVN